MLGRIYSEVLYIINLESNNSQQIQELVPGTQNYVSYFLLDMNSQRAQGIQVE